MSRVTIGKAMVKPVLALVVIMSLLGFTSACVKQTEAPRGATAVSSQEQAEVEQLDLLAGEIEQMTEQGKIAEARERLNRLGEAAIRTSFDHITGVEGLRSLTDAILAAQREYNRAVYSQEEAAAAIVRLRLVTDAMAHPQTPMWHRYYKLIKEDIRGVETALAANNRKAAEQAFTGVRKRYMQIRPALTVKKPAEQLEKLDSLLVYMQKELAAGNGNSEAFQSALKESERSIDVLFERKEDSTAYLPLTGTDQPLLWTFGIGSILTAVLSFVAWRMFRFEKRIAKISKEEVQGK
jgi:sporulation protein YpjB